MSWSLSFLAFGLMAPAIAEDPADPAIVVREFLYEQAPFPSCHASTIAETPDGLVAAWFGGTLMGAVGVNGAAADVDDPRQDPQQPRLDQVELDRRHPLDGAQGTGGAGAGGGAGRCRSQEVTDSHGLIAPRPERIAGRVHPIPPGAGRPGIHPGTHAAGTLPGI